MNLKEVAQELSANKNRTVSLRWADGEIDLATVVSVDDEGFVFESVTHKNSDPMWTRFEDIIDVQSVS